MVEINSWQFSVPTEVGVLTVEGNAFFVTYAGFHRDKQLSGKTGDCALKAEAKKQVKSYLSDASMQFELPVMTLGSQFQQSVWSVLEQIPPGQTRTYGEVARILGSSARAVGGACKKNPVAVIVPCHRVVAANGLGGYGGKTAGNNLRIKSWLLAHEA